MRWQQRLFLSRVVWAAALMVSLVPAFGQSVPLSLDLARFQDAKGQPYLEIYYSFPEKAVRYVPTETGAKTCRLVMAMLVFKEDSLWASKAWKIERAMQSDSSDAGFKDVVDLFRYFIDVPARYRVVMQVRDLNQEGQIDSVEAEIVCSESPAGGVAISDLELASNIERFRPGTSKRFRKRNYVVVPHPRQVFGQGLSQLYYYFEVYRLRELPGTKYKRLAYLKDARGEPVQGLGSPTRTRRKRGDTAVEMGMINVGSLPSGRYSLVYGVADSNGAELVVREKSVFIYNPQVVSTTTDVLANTEISQRLLAELAGLSDKELDQEFDYLRYLTDRAEKSFYKNLANAEAKRKYLAKLWETRARQEGLLPSDFRARYLVRVERANAQFKAAGGQGWKTDQGRVLILYGPPTSVDRFPSTAGNKPYEIWTYDNLRGQGGVEFIFVDRFGFRKYELMHSTLRGELQDPNWRRFVFVGPGK